VRILDERRGALVERERELLERLAAFLQDFGAPPEDVGLVQRAHQDLEELLGRAENISLNVTPYHCTGNPL
jgi:hypothetical protein